MRSDQEQPEANLDKVIEEIRNQPIEEAAMENAANRAWSRVSEELRTESVETIRGCADFQALIPAYRAGELSKARALLVKDHLHECVACRKEFMKQSTAPEAAQRQPSRSAWVPRWAVAAALVLAAGASSWHLYNRFGPPTAGPVAVVQSVNGTLLKVASQDTTPIAAGTELAAGERVRTVRDSSATVRLHDGSLVELRERSGFAVSETRRDITIRMARGSVIVEAAKRSSGHLYVSTRDCRVAVTGTVFSVNSGAKGSRVSVIEGEVRVAQGSAQAVLHPGEQYSSSPAMSPVSVQEEISWSQNAGAHIALLKELVVLGKEMDRQVRLPAARYSSRLLSYVPQDTALYMAIPNLGETMAGAYQVFEQRVEESPALREWWEKQMSAKSSGPNLEEIIGQVRRFSAYLGDEIVITAALDANGKLGTPVLLVEVKQSGFPEFVKAEASNSGDTELDVFDSATAITSGADKAMLLYVREGVAAMAPDAGALGQIAESVEGGGAGSSAGSSFHNQIAEAYTGGTSLLFCLDLERLTAGVQDAGMLGNVRHMIVEQTQEQGVPDTHAALTFAGPRKGVASWLAAPSPIGALDFVSPEASMVSAAAVRQPASVLDDLFTTIPKLKEGLSEAEAKLGFSVRDDLAAALGSEFAFALDGPVFPVPSWKLVAEVYDASKLQWTLGKVLDAVNQAAAEHGEPLLQLTEEAAGARTCYTLTLPKAGPVSEIHYVFVDGYLLAAPSRALLEKAIENRDAGNTLVTAAEFISLLPRDGHNNFSAMAYHNIGPVVAPLAELLGPEQRQSIEGLNSVLKPSLVLAYASEDRIMVASTSEILGFTPGNLFGLRVPLSLKGLFGSSRGGAAQQ